MKNENTDKSLGETTISMEQSSVKTCPFSNLATLVCCSKTCDKIAFICGDESCKCYKQHNKCPHLSIKSILNTIQNKIIPFENFQQYILDKIDKTIDQLSKLKENLQTQIKQDLALYGLTIKDKNLLNDINSDKITGKQINTFFNYVFVQENKFVEKESLQDKFSSLWKSVDSVIKDKSSQLYHFLESMNEKIDKIENFNIQVFKDSKIISTKQNEVNLIKMFSGKVPRSAKLLYRASQNNFSKDKFHEKCDETPHTLTICETIYGKVIGGYTPLVWNKSGNRLKDQSGSSFIFSLTNNHKFSLDKSKDAIWQNSGHGPIFGSDHPDFYICKNANNENSSCTKINQSYINQNYTAKDQESYMKFNGNPDKSHHYITKDWQVWQLTFQ